MIVIYVVTKRRHFVSEKEKKHSVKEYQRWNEMIFSFCRLLSRNVVFSVVSLLVER